MSKQPIETEAADNNKLPSQRPLWSWRRVMLTFGLPLVILLLLTPYRYGTEGVWGGVSTSSGVGVSFSGTHRLLRIAFLFWWPARPPTYINVFLDQTLILIAYIALVLPGIFLAAIKKQKA